MSLREPIVKLAEVRPVKAALCDRLKLCVISLSKTS
jgi:hypothetical protein